jgi:hypothetical protein
VGEGLVEFLLGQVEQIVDHYVDHIGPAADPSA